MNVENKIHVSCNFSFYFQSKIDSVNFRQKIEVLDNRFKWLNKDKKITLFITYQLLDFSNYMYNHIAE